MSSQALVHRRSENLTQLLVAWSDGDEMARDLLIPLVYDELHRRAQGLMRRERPSHTLQPTALVHETYLELVDQKRVKWRNRAHFFGVAAHLMRRITMLHARRLKAAKRGGEALHLVLDEALFVPDQRANDLLALDDALTTLEAFDPTKSKLVELRYFSGLTLEETAEVLRVSVATVKREWQVARAWLLRTLRPEPKPT